MKYQLVLQLPENYLKSFDALISLEGDLTGNMGSNVD